MILVIDVGTTGLRAALVDDTAAIRALHYRPFPPSTPSPGLVEFDATEMGSARARRGRCGDRRRRIGSRHRRRDHEPAGEHDHLGSLHGRADRARTRLAGPAHRRRVHHGQDRARVAAGTEPVGDEDRLVARQHARRRRSRPVLRHSRLVGGVGALGGRAARHRPLERGRHRPVPARRIGLEPSRVRAAGHSRVDPSLDRRLVRPDRDRVGAARRTADRGDGRRPAGVIGRPGLRPPRPREDHVRHGRDARRLHGQRRARTRRTAPPTARSRSSRGHTGASSRGASRRSC